MTWRITVTREQLEHAIRAACDVSIKGVKSALDPYQFSQELKTRLDLKFSRERFLFPEKFSDYFEDQQD